MFKLTCLRKGGDVDVETVKEGALSVYSGQRQFPLTFQMPESGLALAERRCKSSYVWFPIKLHCFS
jgi:hypothetical protein